jgi:hypothetical protein
MINPPHFNKEDHHMSRKRTPDEESTQTTTTVTEPPAAEAAAEPRSFAERVGQRNRVSVADPFGFKSDNLAGVRLFESKLDRQMALKFEEKPSQAVIDTLKDAGYRWNPSDRIWATPVRFESANTTRVEADRLYEAVVSMIRQEKGIEAGQDVSR